MNDNATAMQRDKLVADLRAVIADAEELLRLSVNQTGDEAVKMRERLQDRLLKTKERLLDVQHAAFDKAREAGRAADDYVHEHPWTSIGLGAGAGLLVGLLIGRR